MEMNIAVIYILIAVFALITIILVWFAAKTIMDMRRRQQAARQRRRGGHPTR